MQPLSQLPKSIPATLAEYREWKRQLSELPAVFGRRLAASEVDQAEVADLVHRALAAQPGSVAGHKPAGGKAKTMANRLSSFLNYKATLRSDELAALSQSLGEREAGLAEYMARPSVSFFRSTFVDEPTGEEFHSQSLGWTFHRLSPGGPRIIDAYVRTASQPHMADEELGWYSSPGSSFLFVYKGEVLAKFYQLGVERLEEGTLLYYDGSHPHQFLAVEPDTRAIDVSANTQGVSQEFFVAPFLPRPKGVGSGEIQSKGLEAWVRLNIAIGLHAARLPMRDLAAYSKISRGRLQELFEQGGSAPDLEEIEELSYLLRTSVSKFFLPFGESRMGLVCRAWTKPELDRLFRAPGIHMTRDPGGYYGAGHWRVTPIHSIQNDRDSAVLPINELGVSAFKVCGPARGDAQLIYHHYVGPSMASRLRSDYIVQDPGEEFLFVRSGSLGVKLRTAGRSDDCEGQLDRNDAIWYSSHYEHAHFKPDNAVSDAEVLYFWSPYPVMNRRDAAP